MLNLVCSPSTITVVEKSILFNDEKHVVLTEKVPEHYRAVEQCHASSHNEVIPNLVNFSPSARKHHTFGTLGGLTSVVGDNVQPESWRGAHWEHVDVQRYISRRPKGWSGEK